LLVPSITTWTRLEPLTSSEDVASGVAARIHDPLWLLSRQWQVAEFQGEDGGSPIVARWRGTVSPLTRYHLGPIEADTVIAAPRMDLVSPIPLEAFVERQPVHVDGSDSPTALGLRIAIDTGRHFLRLIAGQPTSRDYASAFVGAYGLQPLPDESGLDSATRSFLRIMAGRAVDGRRLRAALANNPVPDLADETIAPADVAEVRAVCADWLTWVDRLFSQPGVGESAWQPDRMEYAFSMAGRLGPEPADERTLTAARYADGTLDWYSFDLNGEVQLGTTADEAGELVTRSVIPAPVTLPAMPAHRFWEFEDAVLDLGALQPGAADLVTLLIVEAITGFGNDWFVIPVDLPVGTLVVSRSLVVTDTFGFSQLVRPNGDPELVPNSPWCMFQLAMPFDKAEPEGIPISNLFFLAPTLVHPHEGDVLEEVMLVRDEMANLGWAVESRLESPMERGLDVSAYGLAAPTLHGEDALEMPQYELSSPVPAHWIPLLPVATEGGSQVRLTRAALLDLDGGRRVVRSQARVLGEDPLDPLLIREEEVPREGAIVRRSYQGARWYDGELIVWSAYRKSVGRGEGSSGLRFDRLRE
jgi:hypothetical protein